MFVCLFVFLNLFVCGLYIIFLFIDLHFKTQFVLNTYVLKKIFSVSKDVTRTDRTHPFFRGQGDHGSGKNENVDRLYNILLSYSMFNFDTGYVQGMNDLLAPILFVNEGDESEAFHMFVALMRRRAKFFAADQVGMTACLEMFAQALRVLDPEFADYLEKHDSFNCFFAYRWFLCLFKREFSFEDTMRLWEVWMFF